MVMIMIMIIMIMMTAVLVGFPDDHVRLIDAADDGDGDDDDDDGDGDGDDDGGDADDDPRRDLRCTTFTATPRGAPSPWGSQHSQTTPIPHP
jgi:hypothetical protein